MKRLCVERLLDFGEWTLKDVETDEKENNSYLREKYICSNHLEIISLRLVEGIYSDDSLT